MAFQDTTLFLAEVEAEREQSWVESREEPNLPGGLLQSLLVPLFEWVQRLAIQSQRECRQQLTELSRWAVVERSSQTELLEMVVAANIRNKKNIHVLSIRVELKKNRTDRFVGSELKHSSLKRQKLK